MGGSKDVYLTYEDRYLLPANYDYYGLDEALSVLGMECANGNWWNRDEYFREGLDDDS